MSRWVRRRATPHALTIGPVSEGDPVCGGRKVGGCEPFQRVHLPALVPMEPSLPPRHAGVARKPPRCLEANLNVATEAGIGKNTYLTYVFMKSAGYEVAACPTAAGDWAPLQQRPELPLTRREHEVTELIAGARRTGSRRAGRRRSHGSGRSQVGTDVVVGQRPVPVHGDLSAEQVTGGALALETRCDRWSGEQPSGQPSHADWQALLGTPVH